MKQEQVIPFFPVPTVDEMKHYNDLVNRFIVDDQSGESLSEPRYHDFAEYWKMDITLSNTPRIYRKLLVY